MAAGAFGDLLLDPDDKRFRLVAFDDAFQNEKAGQGAQGFAVMPAGFGEVDDFFSDGRRPSGADRLFRRPGLSSTARPWSPRVCPETVGFSSCLPCRQRLRSGPKPERSSGRMDCAWDLLAASARFQCSPQGIQGRSFLYSIVHSNAGTNPKEDGGGERLRGTFRMGAAGGDRFYYGEQ